WCSPSSARGALERWSHWWWALWRPVSPMVGAPGPREAEDPRGLAVVFGRTGTTASISQLVKRDEVECPLKRGHFSSRLLKQLTVIEPASLMHSWRGCMAPPYLERGRH